MIDSHGLNDEEVLESRKKMVVMHLKRLKVIVFGIFL